MIMNFFQIYLLIVFFIRFFSIYGKKNIYIWSCRYEMLKIHTLNFPQRKI